MEKFRLYLLIYICSGLTQFIIFNLLRKVSRYKWRNNKVETDKIKDLDKLAKENPIAINIVPFLPAINSYFALVFTYRLLKILIMWPVQYFRGELRDKENNT